jgi:hypothetical protein
VITSPGKRKPEKAESGAPAVISKCPAEMMPQRNTACLDHLDKIARPFVLS